MKIKNIKHEQTMNKRQYRKPETKALIMEDLMEVVGDNPSFGVNVSRPQNHEVHSKEDLLEDEEEAEGGDSTSVIWNY